MVMGRLLGLLSLLSGASLCLSAPVASLSKVEPSSGVPGEWLIVLREDLSANIEAVTADIAQAFGAKVQITDKYELGKFRALRVTADDDTVHQVRRHKHVIMIEPNGYVLKASSDECWTQHTGAELWGLSRIASRDTPNYTSANYTSASGGGTEVYVIDSGVNIRHREFEGRAGWGMTVADLKEEGDDDLDGHGTHVAGTVAGKTYGVAKKARVVAVKVLDKRGHGKDSWTLEGLQWILEDSRKKTAKYGSHKAVINFSLGVDHKVSLIAIHEVVDLGLPVVIAAGNSGFDAIWSPSATASSAITVAATTKDDKLASFSNYGACVDILAPGENILSAFIGNDTASVVSNGTSMATPHVTGMAARYLSQHEGDVSPHEVKAWLLKEATLNKIDLLDSYRRSTPNRLLYGSCHGASIGGREGGKGSETHTGGVKILLYIILTFVILIFVLGTFKCILIVKARCIKTDYICSEHR